MTDIKNRAHARSIMIAMFVLTSFVLIGCGPETYQAPFLVTWSADGAQAAVVPNIFDDKTTESGLWLYDRASGKVWPVYRGQEGYACIQPQWSPFGPELLFGTFKKEDDEERSAGTVVSLWVVRAEGYGARQVAETLINDDDDSILMPNGIAWGPNPGTILFQKRVDDHTSTAVVQDLCTGGLWQILPHPAASYTIEISPSRKLIAAALISRKEDPAELWVADFAEPIWRRFGSVTLDPDLVDRHSSVITWAPDSGSILVSETESPTETAHSQRYYLRWIDVKSGASKRIETGKNNAPPRWRNAFELFYGAEVGDGRSGIFELNLHTGVSRLVVSGEEIHLLSWDAASSALSFYAEESVKGADNKETNLIHFFRCSESGSDRREIMSPLASDDLGWAVSPDGGHAILFATSQPVISLDLPDGLQRRNLSLVTRER